MISPVLCVSDNMFKLIFNIIYIFPEYRLALSRHNQAELQNAMTTFEDTLEKFVDCAEGYALYGQVRRCCLPYGVNIIVKE